MEWESRGADEAAGNFAFILIGVSLLALTVYVCLGMLSRSPDAARDRGLLALKVWVKDHAKAPGTLDLPKVIEGCTIAEEPLLPLKPPTDYETVRSHQIELGVGGRPAKKLAILLSASAEGTSCAWFLWDGATFAKSHVDWSTGKAKPPEPLEE